MRERKIQSPVYNATVAQMVGLWYRNTFNYRGRSTKEERAGAIPSSICGILVLIYSVIATLKPEILRALPFIVVMLPVFILPWVSYIVRRLHDVGKSAGHLMFLLIPVYGIIYIIFELNKNSENGLNRWGYPCSQYRMANGYRVKS